MANVLSRLSSFSDAIMPDRRRVVRAAVRAEVNVTLSNGSEIITAIADLSTHGCCLSTEAEAIRVGGFIAISRDTGHPLQAIVRWKRDGNAGVEFLRPVPGNYTEWHDLMDSLQSI
jgi:PilZ domain